MSSHSNSPSHETTSISFHLLSSAQPCLAWIQTPSPCHLHSIEVSRVGAGDGDSDGAGAANKHTLAGWLTTVTLNFCLQKYSIPVALVAACQPGLDGWIVLPCFQKESGWLCIVIGSELPQVLFGKKTIQIHCSMSFWKMDEDKMEKMLKVFFNFHLNNYKIFIVFINANSQFHMT